MSLVLFQKEEKMLIICTFLIIICLSIKRLEGKDLHNTSTSCRFNLSTNFISRIRYWLCILWEAFEKSQFIFWTRNIYPLMWETNVFVQVKIKTEQFNYFVKIPKRYQSTKWSCFPQKFEWPIKRKRSLSSNFRM